MAIIFSSFWLTLDLDIKRLEPYLQISKAQEFPFSRLFLDYSFESAFTTPYRALKRRHWVVALTSSTFLLITILLAPSQSALLGVDVLDRVSDVEIGSWTGLRSPTEQETILNGETVNHARSILADNAAWPPFTTSEYAVSPFQVQRSELSIQESWNATAQVYGAEPFCVQIGNFGEVMRATFEADDSLFEVNTSDAGLGMGEIFSDISMLRLNFEIPEVSGTAGQCNLTTDIGTIHTPLGQSIFSVASLLQDVYADDIAIMGVSILDGCKDYSIFSVVMEFSISDEVVSLEGEDGRMGAPIDTFQAQTSELTANEGLLEPDFNFRDIINVTAAGFLCGLKYFRDTGRVSFDTDMAVSEVYLDGSNNRYYLSESDLNIDTMQNTIALPDDSRITNNSGPVDPNQVFIYFNPTSMSTILKARMDDDSLRQPSIIQDSIEDILRSLSSLQFASIIDRSDIPATTSATHTQQLVAIRVNRTFAIISEIILGFSALTCFLLIFVRWNTKTILRHDPDSLGSFATLISHFFSDSDSGQELGSKWETAPSRWILRNTDSYFCKWTEQRKHIKIVYQELSLSPSKFSAHKESKIRYLRELRMQSQFPNTSDILFFFALCVALIGSSILFAIASSVDLTYLADSTSFKAALLWQFLPTVVVSFLVVGWTVIHRDMSNLEPWISLHKGAPAARSLSPNYASRPPLFVLYRSLNNRNIFITIVSIVTLSTSLLSVMTGGWFSQSFMTDSRTLNLPAVYGSSVLPIQSDSLGSPQNVMSEVLDLVRTNITDNTLLPPWMSKEYFFLPLDMAGAEIDTQSVVNTRTVGVGASLDCSSIGPYMYSYDLPGDNFERSVDLAWNNETGEAFFDIKNVPTSVLPDCFFWLISFGPNITRYSDRVQLNCQDWVGLAEMRSGPQIENEMELYGTVCRIQLEINVFDITTNANGMIQSFRVAEIELEEDLPSTIVLDSHLRAFNNAFKGFETAIARNAFDYRGLLTARTRELLYPDGARNNSVLETSASQLYAQAFSSYLALYQDEIFSRDDARMDTPATITYRIARWQPSIPAFTVSLILFVAYILAAIYVYFMRRRPRVPRMPKSLGDVLPWMIHSRILKDFEPLADVSSSLRDDYLAASGKEYRFGWFRDVKGVWRLGLEESRYIEKEWDPAVDFLPEQD